MNQKSQRPLEEIENDLDELQLAYLDEEDEKKQMHIEWRFSTLLEEATEVDGLLRIASGVTIHNWTRETQGQ